ncbi:MAG: ABC transporter substrate-binding protein [Myxococcota bacterium]
MQSLSFRVKPYTGLLALLSAFCWMGCGGPQEPEGGDSAPALTAAEANGMPERGDWLVQWSLADPESLNPITSSDSASSSVLNWIMPTLLTIDNETLELRPVIARALPDISEDKLVYTFHLRDDVTFPGGRPVTAEDFVFTLKVIKNPAVLAPHLRNYLNSVADASAPDPHTLRIDLRERYFRNTYVLGSTSPLPRYHYDPENLLEGISIPDLERFDELDPEKKERVERFAQRFNEDFHRLPVGAGAFEILEPETDIVTGEKIVLRRRSDFWAPDEPLFGDAWVNRIVYRVINDREAALVAFKGGQLDVVGLTPIQNEKQTNNARFRSRANKRIHTSPGYTYIGWNMTNRIFQDVRVRRALAYFVDKQNIIDKLLRGLAVPVEGSIFVERPEYNQNLPAHVFDPEKGKALLREAGWEDTDGDGILDKEIDGARVPLRFDLLSNTGNDIRKAVGLAVIDEMKRAGIDASFRGIDWSIMLGLVKKFDYDAVILGWGLGLSPPDPYQLWHSSQAVEGGSNHVYFKNDEVDQILEAYRVEFDAGKRKLLIDRFQEIIYEEQPYTFLFMQQAITAWDRRFHGVTWYPSGGTDLNEWWVPLASQRYR